MTGRILMTATAEARTNIALVKYWGKRDAALNLPAAGSLSLTLDGLDTRTTVAPDPGLAADRLTLGGVEAGGEPLARVAHFLDLVRARVGGGPRAHVTSRNSFPTASGLASSASAFAALALAAARAYGLDLDARTLSALARRGSGSAARSIFGGLVRMRVEGAGDDDAWAEPVATWDLRLVIGVVGGGQAKAVLSRAGMDHTAATSPLYAGWLACVPGDLAAAEAAIARRDLPALGAIAEASALTMHASALGARPAVVYWRGATVEALHAVAALRRAGVGAWATIDAGPHVKVLCAPGDAARVAETLGAVAGVTETLCCAAGEGARIIDEG
jgi:diphosphomevalonate decarboxylase